jgi:glycosyltransferase involved in cell wall biosynthesis
VRVAHVSDAYLPRLGGIEAQVHGLALHQRALGIDAEVVTATPKARHDRTTHELVDGVPVHRITVDLPYELPVHPHPGREVLRVVEAGRFDAVHLHFGVIAPFVQGAAPSLVRAHVPLVATVHSLWGPAVRLFRAADRVWGWSRWPVVFTAVSGVAAEPIRSVLGGRAEVGVLPNGIAPEFWLAPARPPDPAGPLPGHDGRGDAGEVLLVSAMRLAPRKRPLPLLEILRVVRDRVPPSAPLRAVIAGEGPQRAAMERHLRRHDLSWVELPGRLTPAVLRDLYHRADLYLSPGVLEAFGIAALEARTAGLPVLARAGTGVSEFVAAGVEGVVAPSDAALAAATVRLVRDPVERASMAAACRARPPAVTWPDVVELSAEFYARAVDLMRARR